MDFKKPYVCVVGGANLDIQGFPEGRLVEVNSGEATANYLSVLDIKGDSLESNIQLVYGNAVVASELAVALAALAIR